MCVCLCVCRFDPVLSTFPTLVPNGFIYLRANVSASHTHTYTNTVLAHTHTNTETRHTQDTHRHTHTHTNRTAQHDTVRRCAMHRVCMCVCVSCSLRHVTIDYVREGVPRRQESA